MGVGPCLPSISAAPGAPRRSRCSAGRRWLLAASALPLLAARRAVRRDAARRRTRRPSSTSPPLAARAAPRRARITDGPGQRRSHGAAQRHARPHLPLRRASTSRRSPSCARCPDVRKALDMLRPGDIITLTHVDGVLQSLNRRISDTLTLSVSRAGDGFAVNYIENPLEIEVTGAPRAHRLVAVRGRVATPACPARRSWCWPTRSSAGTSTSRTTSARATSSACSTSSKFQDGQYVSDGRVLAAEFVNRGKTHRAVWFESADGKVQRLLHARGQGHAQGLPARAARFHAHQLALQPEPPAPDHRQGARAQGHRLRGADRHADLCRGRRPHRVRRAQGRLRQRRGRSTTAAASPRCTGTCRASASRRAAGARCGRAK